MESSLVVGIVAAALGGLAIGVERQWSGRATGPHARFAGVRTFTMLGAIGGLSGGLWMLEFHALAAVLLAMAGGVVIVAYAASSRSDIDGTTEVVAVVVLGAGVLAGVGHIPVASGLVAVTALILLEKSRLHALVERIDDKELHAAARFAVMAIVILPLLPAGPYGPGAGVRPRILWMLVLFFSGLNFAGYIARRAVGARFGYPLAGLLGGLVSSTSVTLTYARASRTDAPHARAMAYGVIAACTILFARVLLAVTVLHADLVWTLWPYLVLPFLAGTGVLLLGLRHVHQETSTVEASGNPLQVRSALQMALLFQIVLYAVELVQRFAGDPGVVVSGAVLGLTDVDALTISMARGAAEGMPFGVAAKAIAIGLLANTLFKTAVAVSIGGADFRRVTGVSLAGMAAVQAAMFLVR